MTSDEWNKLYPVGTHVLRYLRLNPREDLLGETVTRSEAWTLASGQPVVLVEGSAGGWHLYALEPLD